MWFEFVIIIGVFTIEVVLFFGLIFFAGVVVVVVALAALLSIFVVGGFAFVEVVFLAFGVMEVLWVFELVLVLLYF